MMGHRGVRLGITYPEVTEMQVRAIFEAAAELIKAGKKCLPGNHDPGHLRRAASSKHQKEICRQVYRRSLSKIGIKNDPVSCTAR